MCLVDVNPFTDETAGLSRKFRILHFNDVYNITENGDAGPGEVVGGVPRFGGLLRRLQEEADTVPFVTFGGDCLSPSQSECLLH